MDNIGDLLEHSLERRQLSVLRGASEASVEIGAVLYLVGGTVRDLICKRSPMDLDISVEADLVETPDFLARRLGGEVVSQSEFGTAKVRVGDIELDLVSARRESYAGPGALRSVIYFVSVLPPALFFVARHLPCWGVCEPRYSLNSCARC